MDNCICISRTLLSKERDLEIYWGVLRWRGRAKTAFFVGLCFDIIGFILTCVFTYVLMTDRYAAGKIGYILLCVICWLFTIVFILHTVFQGHIFANKLEKTKKKIKGNAPAYTELEFYCDHFVYKSGVFDEVRQIPYSCISVYKETERYCALITTTGACYSYGKEEFIQGSADEVRALLAPYCIKK